MHIPVLLKETIESLNLKKGAVVVDATLGDGGHAGAIMKEIGETGIYIGIDVDQKAIRQFRNSEACKENCYLINDNFANLSQVLETLGIEKVDAILADLGWRTTQMDEAEYGLSFQKEGPLDMRLGNKAGDLTAKEIINTWPEQDLKEIFYKYGEEKHSAWAAKAIVRERKQQAIETTTQLAEIIEKAIGRRYHRHRSGKIKINPATRIFQALRIRVNRELENLEQFLPQALLNLNPGGRLGIITFHSLEDRIVKQFFKVNAGGCVCPKELPTCVCGKNPLIHRITRKPIIASEEELKSNPKSRSAKLRVVEKNIK